MLKLGVSRNIFFVLLCLTDFFVTIHQIKIQLLPLAFRHWKALIDKKPETPMMKRKLNLLLLFECTKNMKKPNRRLEIWNRVENAKSRVEKKLKNNVDNVDNYLKTVPWILAGNSEAVIDVNERRQSLEMTACRRWRWRNDDDYKYKLRTWINRTKVK